MRQPVAAISGQNWPRHLASVQFGWTRGIRRATLNEGSERQPVQAGFRPLAFERKPPRIQVFTRCLKSWLAVAANSFPPKPKSGNALSNAAGNWPDWKRPERTALEVFITGERQGPRPRCNRLCLVTAGESGGEAEAPSFRKGRLHRSQSGAPYARRRLDPLHGLHTPRPAMPNRRLTNCSSRTRHKSDAISITPSAASSTYCPFCQYSQIVIERTSDPGL
jgi:hypothetical protein